MSTLVALPDRLRSVESIKQRGSGWFLLAALALSGLSLTAAAVHYRQNEDAFVAAGATWSALWAQSGLLFGLLFLPIVLAIRVAIAMKVDHDDRNWQRMSGLNVVFSRVLPGKIAVLARFSVAVCLVHWAVMVLVGLGLGFTPDSQLTQTLALALLGSIGCFAAMSVLALPAVAARSFATVVAVGLAGAIAGFLLTLIIQPIAYVYPLTLPGVMLGVRTASVPSAGTLIAMLVPVAFWTITGWAATAVLLRRREY